MVVQITAIELEVLVLKAVWDWINDLVNHQTLDLRETSRGAEIWFPTAVHQRFFNIGLVDLLSYRSQWPFGLADVPRDVRESEQNIFYHLRQMCDGPKFNRDGAAALVSAVDAFSNWLNFDTVVEGVWLPSIETELNMRLKRIEFITICGNIAKHSYMRLSYNIEKICQILERNGVHISLEQGYLVLPEFYEWFHKDIFNYHSSAIAEFLNNIRWAIFDYLQPEFGRSYRENDPKPRMYRFEFPEDCKNPLIRTLYHDLLSTMRREPYMPRFEVNRFLKMRY